MTLSTAKWRTKFVLAVRWVDLAAIVWASVGAYVVRFHLGFSSSPGAGESTVHALLAAVLVFLWWIALAAFGSRETRVLGSGSEEYRRVFSASLTLFGCIAILSYATKFETARGFVGLALPAGLTALIFGRWVLRQILRVQRNRGQSTSRVMVVGGPHATDHLIRSLIRYPEAGYTPVGAYLCGFPKGSLLQDISTPIVGVDPEVDSILLAIQECKADAVAISTGAQLRPSQLRKLGWKLAAQDTSLILAPALTDIAGPRIHTQPVAGLPLIHVSTPKLTGWKRALKRLFDIVVASVLVIILSPFLVLIALAIKLTSSGPVFYRQERIGTHGKTFRMIKFRSMRKGSDDQLAKLLAAQGSGNQPLFKVHNDPRVTKIGAFLRKYSLDEIPQLFNVLGGSMSLVGPRPQREGEVALYDDTARRRLYVSPGMSGLWQVSGRSNLSWEEAIQLDLYYVENWSLMQDMLILLRTFKAVVAGDGAY